MNLEIYSPLDLVHVRPDSLPRVPDDLAQLVARLYHLPRFVDPRYPPGIFTDDVGSHTTRLVIMAGLIDMPGIKPGLLKRMLWIHDIPELIIGEYIAPVKDANAKLARQLQKAEKKAAEKLLQPSDVRLLDNFNSSSAFLKGEHRDISAISPEGLEGGSLDKTDGNMFFHWSLAKWIAGGGDQGSLGRTGLEHTFTQNQIFVRSLESVRPVWPEAAAACINLLDYQIKFIVQAWEQVPTDRIPQLIQHQLASYL
jgi:hypothetical protein